MLRKRSDRRQTQRGEALTRIAGLLVGWSESTGLLNPLYRNGPAHAYIGGIFGLAARVHPVPLAVYQSDSAIRGGVIAFETRMFRGYRNT